MAALGDKRVREFLCYGTRTGREGSVRRRALDTWCLTGADRWEFLVGQVLTLPPPYRAVPGRSVYVIHAGDRAVLVGEQDLTGPLRELVAMILAVGAHTNRERQGLLA